ncbi:hypothetical protein C4097_00140 [Clostridioides difficile]|uniref:hypothetical protein n=1 Tax=Clostridioides sp. GD02404 TaxID=3054354 RepID=UPI00146E7B5A|nr:hypothetical protein [Clostridioides difficile]MDB3082971.1 hypothetical protein [Clostridioides difficile]NMS91521.1 hypothetical protein [Clostridioides difficile]
MDGSFGALIKAYIIQIILVILVFLMAFIQSKFKFKNKSLNFIKENNNVLNIVGSKSYFFIFCIPFLGYVAFALAIWGLFFNLRGEFEKEHTEYLLNVIKSIYDKEEDINRQYKKEFKLIESILSDTKNPYHKMVVENAIVLDSFLNEYNKIKEYFKTEKEDIDMYEEIKISLINFLKCIYNMDNDSKRELILDEKEMLLEDIKKYNDMLKEYTKL